MLYAKFGWPSGSREDDENVKSFGWPSGSREDDKNVKSFGWPRGSREDDENVSLQIVEQTRGRTTGDQKSSLELSDQVS